MSEEYKILTEEELLTGIAKVNPIKPQRTPSRSGTSSANRSSTSRRREEPRRSGSRPSGERRTEEPRRSGTRNANTAPRPRTSSRTGQNTTGRSRKPVAKKKRPSLLKILLR